MDRTNLGSPVPGEPGIGARIRGFVIGTVHVAEWAIAFGFVYVIVSIALAVFVDARAFRWPPSGTAGDSVLIAVHAGYAAFIALLFAAVGCLMARGSWTDTKRLLAAYVPLAAIGPIVWSICYRYSEGAMAAFEGSVWFAFFAYAFWATPLFDFVRHYVAEHTVKYVGLVLSLLPALCAAAGSAAYAHAAVSRERRKRLLAKTGAAAGVIALGLVVYAAFPRTYPFTPETYPRVDGATAAYPFGRELAHRLTGMNRPETERFVRFNTTHNAYVNLIEGKADIVFAAAPSDEERRMAATRGVEFVLTPIGKDAFVFLVHRDNPVQGLTLAQIRDIYSGAVTNWKQVGGEDVELVAYQREANSGSQTFMEQTVMRGSLLAEPPKQRRITGMGGLIDVVAAYTGKNEAIGYSFYYYASEMNKRESIRFLSVDGIEPGKETIRAGTYPLTATLYAVTRAGESADSPASRLLEWVTGPEGSDAIAKGGYIPVREAK
ncbi:PstS family phosphate ABC transporter substrate-binding protein [Paenibacillus sp. GYB003]|uniref:PstS family phosphate ABC transporter substrate-binding protein n=1 Tax=Paenibacillus sp. GYB003 TaxID=2994392 RepID=UPI002F96AED7